MAISGVEISIPTIERVTVTEDTLSADLRDGRTISVPLARFPRLLHATQQERTNWRLIGRGHGIHWPDLDEDVSAEGLLFGKPSGESQTSLQKWLDARSSRLSRHSSRSRDRDDSKRTPKTTTGSRRS
jgi:uncharacterized protein DUF2442